MAKDPTLAALDNLLQDTLRDAEGKEDNLVEKLKKAQELINQIRADSSKGILTKFCMNGQVALVTGGGQGIGRALAHALGEAGCKVAVADINFTTAQTVATELSEKGIPSHPIKVDISIKTEVDAMIQQVLDKFGDLHIACNNAGIASQSEAEYTTDEEWDKIFGVNLRGTFHCCQAEARQMLKNGYGRIINTASLCARIVTRPQRQVVYNTSKAGLVHMTKSLAAEWAERGVTVNCVSPGYVDTVLTRAEHLKEFKAEWIRDIPMKRLADVEELTGAVVYLASKLSSYTTGLDMIIDGGFTCW